MGDQPSAAQILQVARGLIVNGDGGRARALLESAGDFGPALELLAALDRTEGQLDTAAHIYRRALALDPDSETARRGTSVLGAGGPDSAPATDGTDIAPFALIPDLLPEGDVEELLEIARADVGAMVPSGSGTDGQVRPEHRRSLSLRHPEDQEKIRHLVLPAVEARVGELSRALAAPIDALDRSECKFRAYTDRGVFGIHTDRLENRVLTWVYWFHAEPQRFTGGDLLLHDYGQSGGFSNYLFTRLRPRRNALVCFRSETPHEVTETRCDPTDPLAGRFIVHGHLRSAARS